MNPRRRGFTLVELLVVVLAMALLVAIALPSFNALVERNRALAVFHQLTASLAVARLNAVRLNEPVTLCPTRDGLRCRADQVWEGGWMAYRDPHRRPHPARGDDVLEHVDAPTAGMLARSSVGRHRVRFLPTGWASGSNLSVRVCSRQRGRWLGTVVVSNAGRPRTERPKAPETPCPFPP